MSRFSSILGRMGLLTMPEGATRMHLVYPALLVCCVGGLLLISLVQSGQEEQLAQGQCSCFPQVCSFAGGRAEDND